MYIYPTHIQSNYKQIIVTGKEPGQKLKHANAELVNFNFQLQLNRVQYIDMKKSKDKRQKNQAGIQ